MESDIIVEGFLNAESTHGIRYMRVIGDSSVFFFLSKIQSKVPVWGTDVTKLECANHTCKCFRSHLEKLVEEKPQYKGRGRLTKDKRLRLVSAVRCAIKMRSAESDKRKGAQLLRHDIINSVYHVFGQHQHCSDFCKQTTNESPIAKDDATETDPDDNMMKEQERLWIEGMTDADMEESRYKHTSENEIDKNLLQDILFYLNRLAVKSERLLGNFTTNLAESWMGIRCKFDGGKFYNRCFSGSWNARCFGGGLRKNFGPAWSPIIWHKVTGIRPGLPFTSLYRHRLKQLLKGLRSHAKPENKARRLKRKLQLTTQSKNKKAKLEYGGEVLDDSPDVDDRKLKDMCTAYLKQHVDVEAEMIAVIEKSTKGQSTSNLLMDERKKRLKGLHQEEITIQEYINTKSKNDNEIVDVKKMGLVIDSNNNFLAASTDGIVTSDNGEGLLEIKNLLQNKNIFFKEAAKTKAFCLQVINDNLKLNRNHKFYYQCQGQLNIINKPWLDFVVRTTDPYDIHIERIYKDSVLWENEMLPKLTSFYKNVLLPELAVPRYGTTTGIREPKMPWFVSGNKQRKIQKCGTAARKTTVTLSKNVTTTCRQSQNCNQTNEQLCSSNSNTCGPRRSSRVQCLKFVGRRINHEFIVDDKGKTSWFKGTVLQVVRGKDGHKNAVYEIKYDKEESPSEIDNLMEDFQEGSLKFIDLT